MIYILTLSGLIIIYVAIRKRVENKENSKNEVSSFEFFEDMNSMKEKIKELSNRVNDLENSLIILNEIIEQYVEKKDTEDEKSENNDNDIERKDLNDIIFELYDKGMSIDEICSKLMIGKGEVLLRIGLRKQKK
ncbi:hypothetical protein FDN13_00715 [Caloramator sp. E03]|uniref:DUF6115 domain-containing protein n=1 Tax=Caloramator sp. E03 TaxID=2576307 RepID=UPI0011108360|nr:hypothetical protein [Caloramator sp. E03]QCX32332.1 hypothetical protein FDN13_00715 [Caloramator sp. E03]